MKRALITGVTGQDGSYLAELLLSKGYMVHGIKRRSSQFNTGNVDHLMEHERFRLHFGDVCDSSSLMRLMLEIQPHEIYNLAAQSHVRVSFDAPEYTGDATGLGALRVFEAARVVCPDARIYQASSSEMFGGFNAPQNEQTPFHPRSPYGAAKLYAHSIAVNYRESYGMHISCGILFNHESPRRGETFVTRKIARAVARIAAGLQSELALGNLDARRDWGYAPDYCEAMWLMLQRDSPDDYVIGTGEAYSVAQFLCAAADVAGLGAIAVKSDKRYERPAEVDVLIADASKAERVLGWKPRKRFPELVSLMVEAEMAAVRGMVAA